MEDKHTAAPLDLSAWRQLAAQAEDLLGATIIGQKAIIRQLFIAVFVRGHVLLEGDVGIGKTTLLRALARLIGGDYERIEGTIDLLPPDLIYHSFVDQEGRPRVEAGPLLRHHESLSVFFFNEINRSRPQVHSLLLRVMAERRLRAFDREYHYPFLQVFADRNRVEKEETFELPSAARDRFLFELTMTASEETEIQRQLMDDRRFHDSDQLIAELPSALLDYRQLETVAATIQQQIRASEELISYLLRLCQATRKPSLCGIQLADLPSNDEDLIQSGISPRGMSLLLRAAKVAAWLSDRDYVSPEDVHQVFLPAVAHRVFLQPVYELQRHIITPQLSTAILSHVATP